MTWAVVLGLSAAAYLAKVIGLVALRDARLVRRAVPLLRHLPPAVLAGLVIVQTMGGTGGIEVDARLAGLAAAGVAVWRRAPFLVVVAVAAAVTAGLRALT